MVGTFHGYGNMRVVAFLFSYFPMVPHANFLPTQVYFPRNPIFHPILFSAHLLPRKKTATLQILNL